MPVTHMDLRVVEPVIIVSPVTLSLHRTVTYSPTCFLFLSNYQLRCIVRKCTFRTCAPSEDSYQPGHLCSLMRIFVGCILNRPRMQSFFMRSTKTLIRLCRCAGWFESSLGAHVRRYIMLQLICPHSSSSFFVVPTALLWHFTQVLGFLANSVYCIYPKYWDRRAWANSVDPD